MKQELFDPQAFAESSSRIIYTPSTFARTSLLHLQEAGSFQAVYPHTSKRSDLVSCFSRQLMGQRSSIILFQRELQEPSSSFVLQI